MSTGAVVERTGSSGDPRRTHLLASWDLGGVLTCEDSPPRSASRLGPDPSWNFGQQQGLPTREAELVKSTSAPPGPSPVPRLREVRHDRMT
jgi:hypothetical protein